MQKTAFEVRISDWSSDVCSSYLTVGTRVKASYSDANFEVDDAPVDGQNRSGRLSLERTSFFGNADVLSLNAGISRTVSNADLKAQDITFTSNHITPPEIGDLLQPRHHNEATHPNQRTDKSN